MKRTTTTPTMNDRLGKLLSRRVVLEDRAARAARALARLDAQLEKLTGTPIACAKCGRPFYSRPIGDTLIGGLCGDCRATAERFPVDRADGRRVFVTVPENDPRPTPTPPVKPTRDEYIAHAFATFTARSAKLRRGLVVSVTADTIDALVADAQRLGLEVLDVVTHNTGRAQARIWSFRRGGTPAIRAAAMRQFNN